MIRALRSASVLLFLSIGLPAMAGDGWSVRHVSTTNGLPQNSVRDLLMDSLGHLWVTTEGGLARYDGQVFRQFVPAGNGQPRSERMRELLAAPDGSILVSDARGQVYRINGLKEVGPIHAVPTKAQRRIKGGIPSVATFLQCFDRLHPVKSFFEWRWESLWIFPVDEHHWSVVGQTDLLWYEDTMLIGRTPLPRAAAWFMASGRSVIAVDSSGQCFAAHAGDRACVLLRTIGRPWNVADARVRTDLFWHVGDTEGLLLLGDRFFLLKSDLGNGQVRFEALDAPLPYRGRLPDVLWVPREHMLVIGTDIRGLYICQRTGLRSRQVALDAFQVRNTYYAQIVGLNGDVIAMTPDAKAIRFAKDTAYSYAEHMPVVDHTTAVRMPDGTSLYAAGPRVLRYDPRTEHSTYLGSASEHVSTMFMDRDTLWIGSEHGIGVLVNGRFTYMLGPLRSVDHDGVHVIRRGPDSLIWFGRVDGLFRLAPNGKERVVPGFEGLTVRAMETIKGHVFVGTYGNGAYLVIGQQLRPFPQDPWGRDTHVHSFVMDPLGYLWRSTNRGLLRCTMNDVEAWIIDPAHRIHQEYIGEQAGIHNVEFNGGCDPAVVITTEGLLSYPTMDGLVQFNPNEVPRFLPNGHVLFDRIEVNGAAVPFASGMSIGPRVQSLRVAFSTAYWGDPVNLRMEYQLSGWSDEWHALPPDQRTVELTNLSPADYTLRFRMAGLPITDDGSLPALRFTIRAPWYAAPWSIISGTLIALVLLALGVRAYARSLERRNSALERAVQDRTASLMQANEALERSVETKMRLVSIITHDIVAPLRYIARAAGSTKAHALSDKEHLDTLGDIAFASEKLHTNARNLLSWVKQQEGRIELRPTHVAIYPFMEEVFDHVRGQAAVKGISLNNRTKLDDVLLVDRDLLGIVLNNLVSNALTHTEQGHVDIAAGFKDGHYRIIVNDTGPGFTPKAMERLQRLRSGKYAFSAVRTDDQELRGLGYVIVTDLLRILGGRFEVLSNRPTGTRVIIDLPVPGPSVVS